MTKLDEVIERALRSASPSDSEAIREDAALIAKVLVRWHGDSATRVLELAGEFAKATIRP